MSFFGLKWPLPVFFSFEAIAKVVILKIEFNLPNPKIYTDMGEVWRTRKVVRARWNNSLFTMNPSAGRGG